MAYRKRTLRRMSPLSRELAKIIADGQSVTRRLKSILPKVMAAEMMDIAQHNNQKMLKQPCICSHPLLKHANGKSCLVKDCNCQHFIAIGQRAIDKAFPLDV